MVGHAKDGTGADLKGRLVDHVKDAGQALVRQGGLFDLQRAELTVALKNDVDLLGVPIPVEIEIRFKTRVLIALHDLRYSKVFQQRTIHRAAFGHLRRRPAGEIADESGIVEIHLRRLDRPLQDIVGIGM